MSFGVTVQENPEILIVEDETIIALDIKFKLHQYGYNHVKTVSSGEKAILVAQEKCPDLILMDIKLAGDLDGITTVETINKTCHPAIIFMSAFSDQSIVDRAKALKPVGYLTKAASDDYLIVMVKKAIGDPPATQ